jgi:hypothetical protein
MFGSTRLASRLATAGAAAVVVVVGVGVGVAGCSSSSLSSSSSSSASSAAANPAASATSAAASPAPSSGSISASASTPASQQPASPAATAPGAAAAAACPTRYLGAHVGLTQGTAGSIYQVIYFTNLSTAPCTLYGYPGVALAGGTPQVNQIGAAASRSTATAAALVTIGPGQSANALLRIVEAGNYSTAACQPTPTTFLQIFPPNQTTPIYLAYKSTGCASTAVNLLSISVMTPGTGG